MWKSLIVTHPQPHVLVISKSKRRNLLRLLQLAAFYVGSIIFIVLVFFNENRWSAAISNSLFRVVSALLLLMIAPRAISLIKIVRKGEVFTIDKQVRTISKNQQILAGLHEVTEVQIRRTSYAESSDIDYSLLILLKKNRVITVETISDREEIKLVAEQLAAFLQVAVVRKK